MSYISTIRSKKLDAMSKLELLALKQDCIRLITYSDNPRTINQERKYLEKINKRLKELDNVF